MAKKKRVAKHDSVEAESTLDFEAALAEVESIVGKMESGELGLSDSLQQYEIGIKRLKQCHALLQKAERTVTLLSGVDADGNSISEPFDVEDENVDAKRAKKANRPIPRRGGEDPQDSVDDLPGLF